MSKTDDIKEMDAADILADEAMAWYANLMRIHDYLPRTFTGLKPNGEQCSVIMEDIAWTRADHIQRRAFLHWLIKKEGFAAYAYGAMFIVEDDSREVDVFADDGNMQVHAIAKIVARDDGKRGLDAVKIFRYPPDKLAWMPYHGLRAKDAISEESQDPDDEAFFEELWAARRPKSLWRTRPGAVIPWTIPTADGAAAGLSD